MQSCTQVPEWAYRIAHTRFFNRPETLNVSLSEAADRIKAEAVEIALRGPVTSLFTPQTISIN